MAASNLTGLAGSATAVSTLTTFTVCVLTVGFEASTDLLAGRSLTFVAAAGSETRNASALPSDLRI